MSEAEVRVLADADVTPELLARIHRFVLDAFEGEFGDDDWRNASGGWRVVAFDGEEPVSHAAVVPRVLRVGERDVRVGYVEALATAPARQGDGLATFVMEEVEDLLLDRFEMGALSTGLHDFYGDLGWEPWRGPTFVREDGELVRTPEDDDAVMVLRFGPSESLDLEAPIVCDARPGDDW